MWELDYKESWALKNWCFWTVVLEKTLESPLDCKEIQPVHPKRNQSWIFIGRTDAEAETPILWPPDAKNWLTGKDPDAGKVWRWKEKGMTEDEMAGWHRLYEHEFEQAPGVKDREAWRAAVYGVTKSQTRLSDWTELNWTFPLKCEEAKKCVKKVFLLPIHSGVFTQALLSWSALPALQSRVHRGNALLRAWELPAVFPPCALSLDLTASSPFLRAQLKSGFPELSDLPATEAGPATRYGHSQSSGWFYILYSPWHYWKVSELFIWWSAFCQPQQQPTLQASRHFVGLTHFHKTPGRVCGVWKRWSNISWMNELPHVSAQIPYKPIILHCL